LAFGEKRDLNLIEDLLADLSQLGRLGADIVITSLIDCCQSCLHPIRLSLDLISQIGVGNIAFSVFSSDRKAQQY
jgi:hypothetical protein